VVAAAPEPPPELERKPLVANLHGLLGFRTRSPAWRRARRPLVVGRVYSQRPGHDHGSQPGCVPGGHRCGRLGLGHSVAWGWAIVNFVFWIGIGHAGTLISAVLFLLRQRWRTAVNRSAEP